MTFAEFFKGNYNQRIDEIFATMRESYGECTDACRKGYWDCLAACPNPPDPTNCSGECRSGLQECLNSCAYGKAEDIQAIMDQFATIEAEAIKAFTAQG